MLGHPLVAIALGILLGVLLTLLSHRAVGFLTADDPVRGIVIMGAFMAARFVIALAALAVYGFFIREGLVPFGLALTLSFIAGLGYEAVKGSPVHTSRTSA